MATVSLTDLSPDQFYAIQVRALNAEGPSVWGPVFVFRTNKDEGKPAAITGLVGSASGTTYIATWTKPTTNADGTPLMDLKDYEVTVTGETDLGPISEKFYVTVEKFELSLEQNKNIFAKYNDGNAMGTVEISVAARDGAGNVGVAAVVTAGNPPPAAPSNVVAQALPGAVSLRWDPNDEDDFSHYEVYVSATSPAPTTKVARVYKGPGNSFVFKTMTVAPHYFAIRAVDVVNSGANTQIGPITPIDFFAVDTVAPPIPSPSLTTALDTTDPRRTSANISVTWALVDDNDVAGYKVRYSSSASGPWSYIDVDDATNLVRIPNLNFGTVYYVGVQSYDFQANYSQFSPNVNITTPTESAPSAVTASSITAVGGLTSLTVTWTASTAATVKEYEVQIDTVNTFNSADLRTATVGGTLATFTNLKMVNANTGASYFIRVRPRTHSNVVGSWSVAPLQYNSGTAVSTKSDGAVPAAQPTGVSVIPMVQSLEVKWNAVTNADVVTYEVHAGAPGFTPDPTNKTTRIAETTGTSYLLRSLPGATTPLAYNTTYGVRVYAKDVDGMATQTPAEVTGKTLFTTTADINFIARDIGSLKTYRQGTTPVAGTGETLKDGDLWYHSGENNNLYRYNGTTWVDIHDLDIDAAASVAANAVSLANTAQSTADARITTFYQGTAPTSLAIGDLWVDTSDKNKSYRAASKGATSISGTGWVAIQDQQIQDALSNAATAQSAANAAQLTANNRNTTYYQTTMPVTPDAGTVFTVGDIWFDTDDGNRMYFYNGTTFQATQWGGNAIADYSISGVKMVAGSVTAEKLSQVAFSDQAVPNGSLEDLRVQAVNADQPAGLPARWVTDVTASGYVGATYLADTSIARGGAYSLKMTNAANAGARVYNLDILPVSPGESWYLAFQVYAATATTGSAVELTAYFYNSSNTYLSASTLKLTDANTTWQRVEEQVVVPAGAAGMRIAATLRTSATSRSINVDLFEVRRVTTQVMIGNGAVNADKVETNSLKTKNFEAGSITADKISIGTLGAVLVSNGNFESIDQNGLPAGWSVIEGTGTYVRQPLSTAPSGDHVLRITSGTVAIGSLPFAVKPGAFYNFRSKVMHTNGNGIYYIRINYTADYPSAGNITSANRSGFQDIVSGAANTGITSWTQSDYTWTVPTGVYWASISFYNWSASTGFLQVDDVQVQEQLVGTQISAGTITTNHIVTDGLSATTIKTGTLDADRIGANTVDADKIKANTAFAQNLYVDSTIVMGPDTQGAISNTSGKPEIRSSDYSAAGTAGWRLSQDGLDVKSGTINARALLIQDSPNLLPFEVAGGEGRSDAYSNGGYIAWGGNGGDTLNGGVSASYARFQTQSIFFTKTGTAGTDTYFGFASGFGGSNANIPLEQGRYLVSFYVNIPAGNQGSIKNVHIRNQAGTDFPVLGRTTGTTLTLTPTVGGGWFRAEGYVDLGSGTTSGLLFLRVQDNAATTYYFDGIQVERQIGGSLVPSPWRPPGMTRIDGAMIRTGALQSTATTGGQPNWSINLTGDATFANAKINGTVVVNNSSSYAVQSSNYVAGSQGWAIRGDGFAEFRNVTIAGDIGAMTGTFKGTLNVNNRFFVNSDGSFQVGNANFNSAAFRVDSAGNLNATGATISGNIQASSLSTSFTSISTNGTISTGGGNFSVDTNGSLYAVRSNLRGSLQVGDTVGNGIAIYLNSNGIYYNSTGTDGNFWVTNGGNLYANNANFKGTIKSGSSIEAVSMVAATFETNYSNAYRAKVGNGIVGYGSLPAINFYSPNDGGASGLAGDSGAVYLYSRSGTTRLHMDSAAGVGGQMNFFTNDVVRLAITGSGLNIDQYSNLNFGNNNRQMINLHGTGYGIGVQDNSLYFRTNDEFNWFRHGSHSNAQRDPGGGVRNMRLDYFGGLYVANQIYQHGDQAVQSSSRKWKDNIATIETDTLNNIVMKLRPVNYNWIDPGPSYGNYSSGFIAEEVQEILPHLVVYNEDADGLGLSYSGIIPYLTKGVQELAAEVKDLRAEVSRLTKS